MNPHDVDKLRKCVATLRSLSTSLQADSTKLQRRPRERMQEQADEALGVAYIIEHVLDQPEGNVHERRHRDPG